MLLALMIRLGEGRDVGYLGVLHHGWVRVRAQTLNRGEYALRACVSHQASVNRALAKRVGALEEKTVHHHAAESQSIGAPVPPPEIATPVSKSDIQR
ncbi:predicted protein [Plenodomus lingam JN3]|uniref:Predicted protein n=1 Tax=Leptosphaeria maculans (strain JN3 / isolate v23.1.3 / race Av1-4-5-6-7-8) TaxID=985895 RepID=E5A4A1_LEPMJ|nr:predicted protein [Plenodomus lingam JN3]CBX98446.1 predicted protein [Plenodomus lingam JN3]